MLSNRTVWLFWIQGWHVAPWLQLQVAESWRFHNPGWNVQLVSMETLPQFLPKEDIPYVYDTRNRFSPQALADVVRIALLYRNGGVWADATMLCLQPLDNWVDDAVAPAQFWMYHGTGGMTMDIKDGPTIWLIVSEKQSLLISRWKRKIDQYWENHRTTFQYFWLDLLFKSLFETDPEFRDTWKRVPYLSCEDTLAGGFAIQKMEDPPSSIFKHRLETEPPFAIKLSKDWNRIFPTITHITSPRGIDSAGMLAIKLSKIHRPFSSFLFF